MGGDFAASQWQAAAADLCRRLVRSRSRGGVLPCEQPVGVGEIDWRKLHSHALDRLDELLRLALPNGQPVDGGTVWRGRLTSARNGALRAPPGAAATTAERFSAAMRCVRFRIPAR
jgi:hypothetical protein